MANNFGAGLASGLLQGLAEQRKVAQEQQRYEQELTIKKEGLKLQQQQLKNEEKRRELAEIVQRMQIEKLTQEHVNNAGDKQLFQQFLQQRGAPAAAPQETTPLAPDAQGPPAAPPAPHAAPLSSMPPAGALHQQIIAEAQRQGIPPALALSIAEVESNFTPSAIGDNGKSLGIFQLQAPAALEVGVDPTRRMEPTENIRGGVAYAKKKLAQADGDPIQAGILYNGGGDPRYGDKLRRAYAKYATEAPQGQESAVTLPQAPPPDPVYQALDTQQQKALQDVQELTGLQARLSPGSPTALRVEKLIDNARQLASSLEIQKKSTPYGRALDVQEKATISAYQGAVGANIAATRASQTEQGKIRGETEAKAQQTLAEVVGSDKASQYYNSTTGEEVQPHTPYAQVKDGKTPEGDRIVYLSTARLKARDEIEALVPVLQRMGELTRKVYGPGGIFANLAPSGRLDAAAQGLWARYTQTDPDLKELASLMTANIENIGRTLRGVRGAGTEGDVQRQLAGMPQVQGVPDTKEIATRMYNALANAANIHYRAILRNKDYVRPGLELLFTAQEENLMQKYLRQR